MRRPRLDDETRPGVVRGGRKAARMTSIGMPRSILSAMALLLPAGASLPIRK